MDLLGPFYSRGGISLANLTLKVFHMFRPRNFSEVLLVLWGEL